MSDKKRADVLMVEKGLAESRSKAQALIMSGVVYTEKVRIDKPSMLLTDEEITVRKGLKYVSRGALKLEKGIRVFHVDPSDMVVMDVGDSRICCCRMAPRMCIRLMLAMVSWIGSSGRIRASRLWNGRMRDT